MRRKHGLHLVGAILDRLVPTDPTMRGAEARHGLDELVNLGVQERAAILSPECLGLVCCPILPGLHCEHIARPMEVHAQIRSCVAKDEVQTITAEVNEVTVAGGCIILAECILPSSRAEAIHIVARPTDEGVVAGAAIEAVMAGVASEGIGGTVA